MMVMVWPFLLYKAQSGVGTYGEVLYDAACVDIFVVAPVVIATGYVKGVVSKRRRRFGWRHRAGLGLSCLFVFGCYLAGTSFARAATLEVALFCAASFYLYTVGSYLPQNPQGDGPEITGAREWPALRAWLKPFLWDPIYAYMGLTLVLDEAPRPRRPSDGGDGAAAAAATVASLGAAEASVRDALRHLGDLEATGEVRRLGDALAAAAGDLRRCGEATKDGAGGELRRGEAVVLGFHTHGIIPFNAGLMTYGDAWARLVSPTLPRCIVATDAFTHVVPWMRDLGQWLGARECTRECIGKALDDGVSVILVPGGQAEIFSTKSWGDDVTVFRGHRGFVQLALRHRARLVPVFSFGEWEIMDNVHLPRVQRVTRRWFGFPVPFWPYGLLGLPLPRKPPKGITVVVGRPIELPLAKDGRVDDDAVRRCHAKYFDALHDLFERHKAAAGYPKHAIVFDDGPPKHKKKQQ